MRFIGASVAQVFYQQFSESMRQGHGSKILLLRTWGHLAILGFIPTFVFFLFGKDIFSFVFGVQWSEAGEIASCLSPWLYALFISSPTSTAYLVLELQKISLFFGIASLIYRPLWFFIGSSINNIYFSLYAFVISEVCQIILYNMVLWKKMPKETR
jgi:O-antigen/teichoic acid export membrane protein